MTSALIRGAYRRVFMAAFVFCASLTGQAQEERSGHERVQEIPLNKGWNAIYLEVEPADSAPAKVFAGLPVDKVASLFQAPSTNQFVTDPGVDLFKGQGWGVWYAPSSPEAFLKSLDAINGNRAYLIHATKECRWRASGSVEFVPVRWQPDAFNFVGFPVRAQGAPTFAQFFEGSSAHRGQTLYRLVNGRWKKVSQPASESMRSGEAFWIYTKGSSDYQGPLKVETISNQGLVLGRGAAQVTLRNQSPHPLGTTVEHVPASGPAVPLSILVTAYGNPAAPVAALPTRMPAGSWSQPLPPLEAGSAIAIPLECRSAEMLAPRQASLLKITSDLGTEVWVPVSAYKRD